MPQLPYAVRSTLQPESGNLQEILSADEVDFSASRSLSPEGCGDELKSESSPDPASLRHLGSTRGLLEYASLDSNYGSTDRYARDSEGSELLGEVGTSMVAKPTRSRTRREPGKPRERRSTFPTCCLRLISRCWWERTTMRVADTRNPVSVCQSGVGCGLVKESVFSTTDDLSSGRGGTTINRVDFCQICSHCY